jgi:hypothetical protein
VPTRSAMDFVWWRSSPSRTASECSRRPTPPLETWEGKGIGKCTETAARSVWTAPNKAWLELLIEQGRGTCTTSSNAYSTKANNALVWKTVDTLTCW